MGSRAGPLGRLPGSTKEEPDPRTPPPGSGVGSERLALVLGRGGGGCHWGGGHSSARRPPLRPHRPSLGCGMGILWVSPAASFQRAGRPGGMRAMSAHQALGPLMWARVTAAAGWAWSPPPPGPADPPGARVGEPDLRPTHACRGHLHPGSAPGGRLRPSCLWDSETWVCTHGLLLAFLELSQLGLRLGPGSQSWGLTGAAEAPLMHPPLCRRHQSRKGESGARRLFRGPGRPSQQAVG